MERFTTSLEAGDDVSGRDRDRPGDFTEIEPSTQSIKCCDSFVVVGRPMFVLFVHSETKFGEGDRADGVASFVVQFGDAVVDTTAVDIDDDSRVD